MAVLRDRVIPAPFAADSGTVFNCDGADRLLPGHPKWPSRFYVLLCPVVPAAVYFLHRVNSTLVSRVDGVVFIGVGYDIYFHGCGFLWVVNWFPTNEAPVKGLRWSRWWLGLAVGIPTSAFEEVGYVLDDLAPSVVVGPVDDGVAKLLD